MDTFAALALATEPPVKELYNRKPYNRDESIINTVMWRNILGQAVYQVAVVLTMLLAGSSIFDLPFDEDTPFYPDQKWLDEHPLSGYTLYGPTNKTVLYTMVFQTFVFMQCFN